MSQSQQGVLTTFRTHYARWLDSQESGTNNIIPASRCTGTAPSLRTKLMLYYAISSNEELRIATGSGTVLRLHGELWPYYRKRLKESEVEITKAELLWLKKFVDNYDFLLDLDPSLFKDDDIEDFKVVQQIVNQKLEEIG